MTLILRKRSNIITVNTDLNTSSFRRKILYNRGSVSCTTFIDDDDDARCHATQHSLAVAKRSATAKACSC